VSGFAAIVNFVAPNDHHLLAEMTGALVLSASDTLDCWATAAVGMGQTCGTTPIGARGSRLHGKSLSITADARLDGRTELIRRLEWYGRPDIRSADDAQLILLAYDAWDTECVNYLSGDFAFAIWDDGRQRLFCARDRFGIKPLYYALLPGGGIVCSNSLDCVRRHPQVARTLNDLAIADFLLFGDNQDETSTSFANVRRLPPAHWLTCSPTGASTSRYWHIPATGSLRYRRSEEYVDHFADLLTTAVHDRLDAAGVGVWLSGGLDSASLAALAVEDSPESRRSVRALSVVYDSLIADGTRQQSAATAAALDIDLTCFVADAARPLDPDSQPAAEPLNDPFSNMRRQLLERSGALARVWLCGEGADEILWPASVGDLMTARPLAEVASDVARSVVRHRRRPGLGVRTRWNKWRGGTPAPPFPEWVARDLCARYALRERWRDYWGNGLPIANAASHPTRSDAARRLCGPQWSRYFETFDPAITRVPVEPRYPFLDERLVTFAFSIPPVPWCIDKELLRQAMRTKLPTAIVNRPKTALAADPLRAHLSRVDAQRLDDFKAAQTLHAYIDRAALPKIHAAGARDDVWMLARALSLNCWLQYHDVAPACATVAQQPLSARLPNGIRSESST
jgi:asparagine synthase (glutamine-hydrolysing)